MTTVYAGNLAHLTDNPNDNAHALEIIKGGAIWVDDDGTIIAIGKRRDILDKAPAARVVDYLHAWLIPGLIDGHIHFPQYYATAAHGGQLMDWLVKSILPAETALADPSFAEKVAKQFVQHLLSCGTTTAMVYGSQFFHANRALFNAAKELGIRMIAGATLMDMPGEGIPEILLQIPEQARRDAEVFIALCQQEPLLHYAVTPRYALACSEEMIRLCISLLHDHPEIYLQTHINENQFEIETIMGHFKDCRDYVEVYERLGLLTNRTVLAHNVHPTGGELTRIAAAGCSVCHCPSSNLYLGSGLFPLTAHENLGIACCLGTDIGAGTRFSIWQNLSDAYKIQQLQKRSLNVAHLLYLATLGGARALHLDHETGNFAKGKSADFFVLNAEEDSYLVERLRRCDDLEAQLFCLMHLATERQVQATFVQGRRVYFNVQDF